MKTPTIPRHRFSGSAIEPQSGVPDVAIDVYEQEAEVFFD